MLSLRLHSQVAELKPSMQRNYLLNTARALFPNVLTPAIQKALSVKTSAQLQADQVRNCSTIVHGIFDVSLDAIARHRHQKLPSKALKTMFT